MKEGQIAISFPADRSIFVVVVCFLWFQFAVVSLAMEMSPHISFAHFSDADGLTLKNFRLVLEDSNFYTLLKKYAEGAVY